MNSTHTDACRCTIHEHSSEHCAEETNLIKEFGNRNFETSVGWLTASADERDDYCLVFALFSMPIAYAVRVLCYAYETRKVLR